MTELLGDVLSAGLWLQRDGLCRPRLGVPKKVEGHQVTVDMAPTQIYALLHLDNRLVMELEVIFQYLGPFVFEVELVQA